MSIRVFNREHPFETKHHWGLKSIGNAVSSAVKTVASNPVAIVAAPTMAASKAVEKIADQSSIVRNVVSTAENTTGISNAGLAQGNVADYAKMGVIGGAGAAGGAAYGAVGTIGGATLSSKLLSGKSVSGDIEQIASSYTGYDLTGASSLFKKSTIPTIKEDTGGFSFGASSDSGYSLGNVTSNNMTIYAIIGIIVLGGFLVLKKR